MRTVCVHTRALARPLRLRPAVGRSGPSVLVTRAPQQRRCPQIVTFAGEDGAAQDAAGTRLKDVLAEHNVTDEAVTSEVSAVEAEIADLKDRLSIADVRIVSLEASGQNTRDQMARLAADFDNYRKRTAGEKEQLQDSIRGDLVAQLLPLVDNFELARTQVKAETEQEQKINNSYQGLYKQMVDILRGLGVEAIETLNTPFDPAFHEAIMREPNNDLPDSTVVLEFRKGFKLNSKLVRPALVKVSYKEDAPAAAPES